MHGEHGGQDSIKLVEEQTVSQSSKTIANFIIMEIFPLEI